MQRRRFKQTLSLEERLLRVAEQIRVKAGSLPAGAEREMLLKKARSADMAAHINDWIGSPGLQPPE